MVVVILVVVIQVVVIQVVIIILMVPNQETEITTVIQNLPTKVAHLVQTVVTMEIPAI